MLRGEGHDGGFADVVASVNASRSTAQSHAIADEIERALREKFGARDVTVHIEPHDA
jgi:divalent metal cation (Fe/Co/Zn/Cd) transporter